jgi:hypothetical protein
MPGGEVRSYRALSFSRGRSAHLAPEMHCDGSWSPKFMEDCYGRANYTRRQDWPSIRSENLCRTLFVGLTNRALGKMDDLVRIMLGRCSHTAPPVPASLLYDYRLMPRRFDARHYIVRRVYPFLVHVSPCDAAWRKISAH